MSLPMRRFAVGDFDITVAIHGRGSGSPRWMFPDVDPGDLVAATTPYLDAQGDIEFMFSSLIVRFGDRVVLLDAGPPASSHDGQPSVLGALDLAGVSAENVDAVVISHGHDDHIGGLAGIEGGGRAVTFPGAEHYVAGAEVHHWVSGSGRGELASKSLAAFEEAGVLRVVDEEIEVFPGLHVLPSPGHTPGHLSVIIRSNGDRALYVGDALAHQVNVPHPDWNHFSDLAPDPARNSRGELVERAAEGDHLVLASHIPVAGRVRSTSGRRRRFVSDDPLAAAEGLEVAR